MKTLPVVALFSLLATARAHNVRHVHKRQETATSAPAAPAPPAAGTGVPPLTAISLSMPAGPTLAPTTTYAAGASPPISGAPPLPTPFVYVASQWPGIDQLPDTSSPQVREWMKELDGVNIPALSVTKDGTCENDTVAANDAANRGWWTCGGYIRDTDVTVCPEKMDWGLNFDDGPAEYTPNLLRYLSQQKLHATFFVVGSRVVSNPNILVDEYMSGHEISIHTWSHHALTSLTNEQIVAELGWTRKAIKDVLGVTPLTMRPPYGDIDDRVRAISLAMGLVPIIWTRTPAAGQFDTDDWQVASGLVNATDSLTGFNELLGNATLLNTGFIMLEHDIHEQTVDLAMGYYLPTALSHNPPFKIKAIGECNKWPAGNLYLESNTNKTTTATGTLGASNSTSTSTTSKSVPTQVSSASMNFLVPVLHALFAAGLSIFVVS